MFTIVPPDQTSTPPAPPAGSDVSTATRGLGEFLEALAAGRSAPSAGAMLAVTVAGAASLTAMGARLSPVADPDGAVAAAADRLRARALSLADEDRVAYGQVIATRRSSTDPQAVRARDAAWAEATRVPVELSECAAEVSDLAGGLLHDGNPNLAGDVGAAIDLAAGAAHGAARLARINVVEGGLGAADGPGVAFLDRVDQATGTADAVARRVERT